MNTATAPTEETTVLHVGGLYCATEKARVEHALGVRPGVIAVRASGVAQTATVTFDPAQTSVADLQAWVEECGYHCAGRSVPGHVSIRWPSTTPPARASPMTTAPRSTARSTPTARPRRARLHVDGRDGARHAQPLPGRPGW